MSDFDRVRWHCRRGMLELDLILTRFLDARYATLDGAQREVFGELLELPDPELWDLIAGRTSPARADMAALARMLAEA